MPVKRHAAQNRARRENKKRRRRLDGEISASAGPATRELIRVDMKSKPVMSGAARKLSNNGEAGKTKRSTSAPVFRHPKTELEAAIQRYIDLFEFAPIAYVSFDRVGRIQEVNLAAANLLGGFRGSLVGRPFLLHVTKEDGGAFLNHLVGCRSSYSRVETELHLKKKNGEVILAHLASSPTTSSMRNGALLYQTAIVDLTERKAFEEKIQRSEARYRTLFDLVPVAVYVCDADGIIQQYNRRAVKLWGREPGRDGKEPKFCGSYKIFYPDGRPMPHQECPMARALRREKLGAKDLEIIVERPDGERRHVTAAPQILKDSRGKIVGALNCLYDVTDRERAREQLQRTMEFDEAVLTNMGEGLYTVDAEGSVTSMNPAAEKLFGWRLEELRGKKMHDVTHYKHRDGSPFPPDEWPGLQALRNGKPLINCKDVFIRKDGTFFDVIYTASPIREGNKITGLVVVFRDVTEQKRAEAAGMRLTALVQWSHDAVVAKDLNGIVTDWNQSAQRIFGYKPKEIIGKSILTLIPKDRHSEETEILRRIRNGESIEHYETVRCRKDGKLIEVSLTISPIKDAHGKVVGVSKIARDITERKAEQRRLAEQARLLDLTNDAIIVRDHQDRIVYWNQGAEQMYGFSAKEALGKITPELLQTAYLQDYESIRKNLQLDHRWSGELLHTRKDGKRIVVLSRWNLDRDARGQRTTILETNTDITMRKRAEKRQRALYQLAQRQHTATKLGEIHDAALDAILSAMDCPRAAILLFDKDNVMRFVAWRGLSVKYRKAVEGHSPWKRESKNPKPVCINNVDSADIPSTLKSTIRSEGIRAAAFIPLVSSQKLIGKFMTYYDTPHLFSDDELKLASTIATQLAQAIEHKRDEEALREKESELELMVTQTPFMLTRCTRDLRYRYVSRAYADLVGRQPEELAGKQIAEIIGKEALKKILPYVKKVLQGHPVEYEMEIPYQGIGVFWMHSVYTPDRDADGNVVGWFASLAEVSRHKEAEAMLQKSKELLEQNVRERTRDLHNANKELKAEIARRKGLEGEILEVSDREQQRLAQELHDGLCQHLTAVAFMTRSVGMRLKNHRVIEVKDIEKIAELVNNAATDTRNLSRALHRVDVDAGGFVGALEDLVDREMWKIPCRLEVKPSFHLENDTVASHLYRIAREAVINANKHAEAREIVIALRGWRNGIVLSVTDDGVGFPNARNGARGLGFHIMHYRAGLMGGTLKIESPEKGGTRVACYLPNGTLESSEQKKRQPAGLSAKLTKALTALI
jgi:PAS domain S-box-containing protein